MTQYQLLTNELAEYRELKRNAAHWQCSRDVTYGLMEKQAGLWLIIHKLTFASKNLKAMNFGYAANKTVRPWSSPEYAVPIIE